MMKYRADRSLRIHLTMSCLRGSLVFLLSFVPLYSQTFNEDLVKSQYLVHFGDFVTNRVSKKLLRTDELKIGVVGSANVAGRITEHLSQSNMLDDVSVGLIENPDELARFDILYFGPGEKGLWAPYLPKARSTGVLTVGEEHGFAEAGGVIELVVKKNRLRFRLNLDAAHQSGLQINAKLIKLALREAA